MTTLLVFAHDDEAAAFAREGVPHLVTGVGKINAVTELVHAVLRPAGRGVDRVVVLGTAGAVADSARLDTVYRISAAVQHDFSLPSERIELDAPGALGAFGQAGAANGEVERAVIATGDVFVTSDEQRAKLADLGASLVDMESYAFAAACARLRVPLAIFKTPSDFADDSTTMQEWDDVVLSNSEQLLQFAGRHLPELF